MAFYTRNEFSQLCGFKNFKAINVYISRGKVVLSGKLIDSLLDINSEFVHYHRAKNGLSEEIEPIVPNEPKQPEPEPKKEKPKPLHFKQPPPPITDEYLPTQSKHTLSKNDLDIKLKKADLEKRLEEIEILKVKKMKLHGELIPTDLVKVLIREISEGVKLAYIDAIENYTVVISNQKKLTETEKSQIKSHFTPIINGAVEKQHYIAMRGLKAIVAEYSEKKEVGERE